LNKILILSAFFFLSACVLDTLGEFSTYTDASYEQVESISFQGESYIVNAEHLKRYNSYNLENPPPPGTEPDSTETSYRVLINGDFFPCSTLDECRKTVEKTVSDPPKVARLTPEGQAPM